MKTTENIELATVSSVLGALKKYEKKHWSDCVVAWMSDDDHTFGVVGTWEDNDGDLQIVVEEVDEVLEGIWTVADVIDSLEDSGQDASVYLAGEGLYFAIDRDGGIFTEADDDDVVGCYVIVFGEYEEEEIPVVRESAWKTRTNNWKGILEIVTFLLCIPLTAYGLYYNIAALVKHSRPVWESILSIPFLALLLGVCVYNLFFSKD